MTVAHERSTPPVAGAATPAPEATRLRLAGLDDAEAIAALSIQVFLDTYATEGVRPDLAAEAFTEYAPAAFGPRLAEPERRFIVAERGPGLVAFAELITLARDAPAGSVCGAELVRLYVQPGHQRSGLGRLLLTRAESVAAAAGRHHLWLTAWEDNRRALAFYAALGYADLGATTYTFQGRRYGNRVLARSLAAAPTPPVRA